jgi:hypothetical protein
MLMLLMIAAALLLCLALLTWVATRSWTLFAWLTVLPNLLALLTIGMLLSMSDRASGQDVTLQGLEVFLLGYVEALLFTLSVLAALLGLLLGGMLRWYARRRGPSTASNEAET